MFNRLGKFVSRHPLLVIGVWIAILAAVRGLAPRWEDVTLDGDFAYLPEIQPTIPGEKVIRLIEGTVHAVNPDSTFELKTRPMASVAGRRVLGEAFPDDRAKSQVVLIVARSDRPLDGPDLLVANELARRFHNYHGAASFERGKRLAQRAAELRAASEDVAVAEAERQSEAALMVALEALDEAIRLDERFAEALHNQALLKEYLEQRELLVEERAERPTAAEDAQRALALDPALTNSAGRLVPSGVADLPIVDVWTRYTDVIKEKLRSTDGKAQLVIVRLSNEFMATDNVRVMERIHAEVDDVRKSIAANGPKDLVIGVSGSAAVGGDMLRAAGESISRTELYAVILVTIILMGVYRSPLLVLVPLTTIFFSLTVALSTVAALTQLGALPGFDWWNFKVFTTTRIFIVVILYGAGTDYCLFLISRYKEELAEGKSRRDAIAAALAGIGNALAASALTTIVGLAMMFFADFGKFANSGPAIGVCLLVTLAASITLAPALLGLFGATSFRPLDLLPRRWRKTTAGAASSAATPNPTATSPLRRFWEWAARWIVERPGTILVGCVALMTPLAWLGGSVEVTYDLQSELSPSCISRTGTRLLTRHFPIGQSGPLTVVAMQDDGHFDRPAGERAIRKLTEDLYVDGVAGVRSITDPMGERKRGFSLVRPGDWRNLSIRKHRITREVFLTSVPELTGKVARFEVVLDYDPFSLEAAEVLERIDRQLHADSVYPESDWHGAHFYYAGTTSAISDLRSVTRADNVRIEVLVVLAVFCVLTVILRRPLVCLYLILSVLLSYYVTMGATELFFQCVYGDTFQGLDWKVPLFLFVILVAIGQDYNIYLVTRVFEEQAKHGPLLGLERAVVLSGGIITSCGIIMAGTFISMTAGTLRAIVELGFALSLGVLLDTFVVRPILVPTFLALLYKWQERRNAA